jgi:hypothetical protein
VTRGAVGVHLTLLASASLACGGSVGVTADAGPDVDAGAPLCTSGAIELVLEVPNDASSPPELDQDATHLYWTLSDGVHRVPKRGGQASTIVATAATSSPRPIETGVNEVFWYEPSGIWMAPKEGGQSRQVYANASLRHFVLSEATLFAGVAGGSSEYSIRAVPAMGGPETVLFGPEQGAVRAMFATAAALFWVSAEGVFSLPIAGGSASTIVNPAPSSLVLPEALVADDSSVFWVEGGGQTIRVAPVTGGSPTTVHADNRSAIDSLFIRDGFLYWTDQRGGAVMRTARSGGKAAEDVATGQDGARALVGSAECLYWFAGGRKQPDGTFASWRLMKTGLPR